MEKKKLSEQVKNYLFLHLTILVYTGTTILSKYAAGEQFLSLPYILFMGGMVLVLGVYALLWQQAIKPFSPSVAYSNKSVTTIWTLLFSAVLFGEGITVGNVIGAILIVCGVVLVAQDE